MNWNFGEETDDQIRLSDREDPPRPGRRRMRWIGFALLLLAVAGTAGVIMLVVSAQRAEEAERLAIQTAIQDRVDLEAWTWSNGDWITLADLVDPEARPEWARWYTQYSEGLHYWAKEAMQRPQFEVTTVDLVEPDLAEVRVRVLRAEVPDTSVRVEGRFYRQVEGVWQRTAPVPALFGEAATLRTNHFDFNYPARDAATVDAVATVIDNIYADLRRQLALDPPGTDSRLTIQVVPDNFALNVNTFVGPKLVLLSPSLTRTPAGWSEAQALSAALVTPLSRYALDAALAPNQIYPRWHLLLRGVQGWLARSTNSLVDMEEGRSLAPLARYMAENGPPTLASLDVARDPNWAWASGWMTLAADTLVDYGLSTYGEDKVDDLVAGFVQYDGWESLIPAVFGVSVSEFEAGWQASLVD